MISVIISIYNTAPYLRQCVGSVVKQDFKDIEILLINDKSTDNSLEICQKLASKDPRIRIIDLKENVGLARNRFIGLESAKGEYVMFLDSDDWLNGSDCLSAMHKEAVRVDADYVEVRIQRVIDKHGLIRNTIDYPVSGVVECPKLFDDYYLSFFGLNLLKINMAGKLYKKSTIDRANLKPWKYAMGEDLYFNLNLFPTLKRISLLEKVGYNYRFGGMTDRFNKRMYDSLSELYQIKKEMIAKYDYQKAHDYIRIEIKNVLKSDICQAIRFIKEEDKVKELIVQRLSSNFWDDLNDVRGHQNFTKDPFVSAILSHDVDAIYDYCSKLEKSQSTSYLVKRALSTVFRYI